MFRFARLAARTAPRAGRVLAGSAAGLSAALALAATPSASCAAAPAAGTPKVDYNAVYRDVAGAWGPQTRLCGSHFTRRCWLAR